MVGRSLRTPRSAAAAGIAFSVLVTASILTVHLAVSSDPADAGEWLSDPGKRDVVLFGLALMPFACIAFLWFVGVIRDRVGDAEDRFFATLFLGSGLLFIAMLLAATAVAAGLVVAAGVETVDLSTSAVWTFGSEVSRQFVNSGAQVVGVFTTATATILLRTSIGPRWLGLVGYLVSVLLIVAIYASLWVALLFPIWIAAISFEILVASFRAPGPEAAQR